MPTPEELAPVIDAAFWASLLTEEGRPCRPRLAYVPVDEPTIPIHRFSTPRPLMPETLRKLSPATGDRDYVTWRVEGGVAVLTGVLATPDGGDYNLLSVEALSSGAIDIHRTVCLLSLRAGEMRLLSTLKSVAGDALLHVTMMRLLGRVGSFHYAPLFREVIRQGHGGSVWLVPEGASLDGLKIDWKVQLEDDGPYRWKHPEIQEGWLRSIGRLSAVDGAVLVDSQLRVLGFGAFIPTPEKVLVRKRLPSGGTETVDTSTQGGARHRAAVCGFHPS